MKLTIENISYSFGKREILKNISFELSPGNIHFLAGPNGAGKSTLLKILCGYYQPESGRVMLNERNLKHISGAERAALMGVLWQNVIPALDFSVREMTALVSTGKFSYWQDMQPSESKKIGQELQKFELYNLSEQTFNTLSGGEQQRVMLAGLSLLAPQIMLLDEPTSALDVFYRKLVMRHLREHAKNNIVLVITHDLDLLSRADGTVSLLDNSGNFYSGNASEILTTEILSKVYRTPANVICDVNGTRRIFFDE